MQVGAQPINTSPIKQYSQGYCLPTVFTNNTFRLFLVSLCSPYLDIEKLPGGNVSVGAKYCKERKIGNQKTNIEMQAERRGQMEMHQIILTDFKAIKALHPASALSGH